jgi:hypothetical protein
LDEVPRNKLSSTPTQETVHPAIKNILWFNNGHFLNLKLYYKKYFKEISQQKVVEN